MPSLAVESNGRLEKTAVYLNGDQISGIKKLFLNLDEDGTFDAMIQYEGHDKVLYTKNIFTDTLQNIKVVEPSFTEEESQNLKLLQVDSEGDIDTSIVLMNGEALEGLVSLFLHIKGNSQQNSGFLGLFKSNQQNQTDTDFRAEFTFREENNALTTERIF